MIASLSSFRFGLRAKLALSLVLVLATLIASGAYVLWHVIADELYRGIGEHHTLLTRQIATELDDKLRIVRSTLEDVARSLPATLADRPEEMQRKLADKPVLHALYDRVAVLNAKGVVLATAPPLASLHGHSLAGMEHIQQVLRTGKPLVSKPLLGPGTGRPLVNVVVPKLSQAGEVRMIVVGILYLLDPNVVGRIRDLRIGTSGYIVIADRERTIISHRDAERVMQHSGADPLVERMLAGAETAGELTLADGSRAWISYARLRETDWTVAAVYPAAEAYAPITETRGTLATLTFVALLMCPLFAWLIAGPLTHRLDALARQVRAARAARGARLELAQRGGDEVAELATAFNALLDRVEERDQQSRVLALGIDQSEGAVVMLDGEDRVTRWSRGAERMFGWTAAEALGRCVRELHAPMLSEADLLARRARVRAREVLRLEAPRTHNSGRTLEVAVTSCGVFDERDAFVGTMLTYTDVTEARRAERALRESEERLRIAHEAGHIASWVWTVGEDRARWAGDYESLLGVEAGRFSGRFEDYLQLLHPADRALARRNVVKCLKHELPNYRAQERLMLRDGGVRWLETSGQAFYGPDGRAQRMAGIVRDITDAKLAEQALRESRERFEKMFQASPDSIALSNLETGVIVDVNRGFERITGYSRDETIGRTAIALGLWTQPDQRARLVAQLAAGRAVYDLETVLRRKEGTERTVLISLQTIDLGGEPCMLTIGRDVTDAKLAEQALRESRERAARAFQVNPDSITLVTIDDGRMLEVNEGFERFTGIPAADAIGRTALELGLWVDTAQREHIYGELRARRVVTGYEVRFRARDGTIKDGLIYAAVVDIAGIPHGLTITRDMTEKKRSDDALRDSEERFARAFHASPAATALMRRDDGRIVLINEGFEKLYGYSRDEVLGRTVAELGTWVDMAERAKAMARLDAEGSVRDFEAVVRTHIGDLRHVQIAFEPVNIGGTAHVLGVAVDVTERKRYQETLERSVDERTSELQRANRELESFSYTVSHDLRAPLRAIHGFSQLIKIEHAESLPEQAQQLLHRVQDNALRMSTLINDLLEFSRIGRKELVKERIDTRALVRQVLDELADAGAATAEIALGALPDAHGDRALLRIVWSNLISNALKFSRKAAGPRIALSGEQCGTAVEFSVSDNGAGFDMRYAHKLFGVFQRLHSDAEFEGTGAGLSIVRRIVERHGGRVSAEGEPGKGATFGFSIPAG